MESSGGRVAFRGFLGISGDVRADWREAHCHVFLGSSRISFFLRICPLPGLEGFVLELSALSDWGRAHQISHQFGRSIPWKLVKRKPSGFWGRLEPNDFMPLWQRKRLFSLEFTAEGCSRGGSQRSTSGDLSLQLSSMSGGFHHRSIDCFFHWRPSELAMEIGVLSGQIDGFPW